MSGKRTAFRRAMPGLVAIVCAAAALPARAQGVGIPDLDLPVPSTSDLSLEESLWARDLVDALDLEATLDSAASDVERFGLLCPENAEPAHPGGGPPGSNDAFGVSADLPERAPGEAQRLVVSVPATALYQLEVEGAGLQRWSIDGRAVGHLDVSELGVAYAPVILPLRAGPHELAGTLLRGSNAHRVRLAPWRMLCIAPAGGWRGDRTLSWGAWGRTLVRAFGLQAQLPEQPELQQEIEGEDFIDATSGGGRTRRRIGDGASGDAWAMANTSASEFTWRVRLDEPGVVTISARTHGAAAQIWSVDGRTRFTVQPVSRPAGFAWSSVATLPLSAGEHAVRARIGRGAGVDALRIAYHRSRDGDHLRILEELGLPVGAPDSPVPRSRARQVLQRPLVRELASSLRRRMAGATPSSAPVVLVETLPDVPNPRPLSPVLPSEL